MPVLKTIKSRNLKLTANKGDRTTSKSYSPIGVDASDDAIMNTANAIESVMAYPVEEKALVTTEVLTEAV